MAPHLARRIPGKIAWQQMLILSAINFNEAVQGNVIWAFLPFAVQKWGARPNEVGTYVGLLACSFFAAQFLFVGMWGLAADRYVLMGWSTEAFGAAANARRYNHSTKSSPLLSA